MPVSGAHESPVTTPVYKLDWRAWTPGKKRLTIYLSKVKTEPFWKSGFPSGFSGPTMNRRSLIYASTLAVLVFSGTAFAQQFTDVSVEAGLHRD